MKRRRNTCQLGAACFLLSIGVATAQPKAGPERREETLQSWEQGMALMHANRTPVREAIAQLEQAEGLSRLALAGALPSLSAGASVQRQLVLADGPSTSDGSLAYPTTTADASLRAIVPLFAPK